MGRIGFGEVLFIALVIVLLFGANKLPEIGNALGKAIKEFRKAAKDVQDDVKKTIDSKANEPKT